MIKLFKVMCSKCGFQIKEENIEFVFAPEYKWLKCPKCGELKFNLLQNK